MDDFQPTLDQCHLSSLPFIAKPNTWESKNPGINNVNDGLNYTIFNIIWSFIFSSNVVAHLDKYKLDH